MAAPGNSAKLNPMKKDQLLVGLAFCFLGTASLQAGLWGSYQHDSAHTGRTNAAVRPTKLSLAWTAPEYQSPLIAGDTVYAKKITGDSTDVTAFSLADGAVQWTYPGAEIYFGNLALGGNFAVLEGFDFSGDSYDALTVLDRHTGQLLYKMTLPLAFSFLDPTLVRDALTGRIVAYCNDSATLVSVALGRSSGQILWTQEGDFGSSSAPTIAGESVIVFGAFAGTALDRTTGSPNTFYSTASSANVGGPAVFNAARSDFYVRLDYAAEGLTKVLAFHYDNNDAIQLLWTHSTSYVQVGGAVALGADGSIYVVAGSELAMLDPADGSTIRSIPFSFVNGCTPALSRGVLWAYSDKQTFAFDAASLELLQTFESSSGFGHGFVSPGAFVRGTAALNAATDLAVYQETSRIR